MDEAQRQMTQDERDWLVALKQGKKKLITQKQAAEEIGVTERQVPLGRVGAVGHQRPKLELCPLAQ